MVLPTGFSLRPLGLIRFSGPIRPGIVAVGLANTNVVAPSTTRTHPTCR